MGVKLPGQQGDQQPEAQVIEKWAGINTKASRPGIGNEEFSWSMNWMPIGDQNLRTLYAEGDVLYTVPNPLQNIIIYTFAYNLGSTSYQAVFLSDGTAYQVNRATGAITTISATPGTFWTLFHEYLPHCAQWKSELLIIVSSVSEDGFWIWNGTALFGPSTLSPDVTILDIGRNYTSAPTVTAYGGSGSGATFSATIADEGVIEVDVINPGSGYQRDDIVTLGFSGGGSDTTGVAVANVTTTSGGVARVEVVNAGFDYNNNANVTLTGGGGSGATAIISTFSPNRGIIEITVINSGTGYTSAPTVTITFPGTGVGFSGVAILEQGQVTSATIANPGSGYVTPPDVVITGDGTGATATATIGAGQVTGITIRHAGTGYSYAGIELVGGNNAARATASLMPRGIAGTSVETFQSRVWVSDVTKAHFTAPASTSDFATSSGGGTYDATESFLRQSITRLIQASGFLYQIADSSINVISNVQTNGDPPTTTFNNSNIDPQVGCPWRDTVQAFGRALVFANSTGVYALYGGAAEKVSGPLDGLFANASFNTGESGLTPTAGVATIFGIRCYCLLFTTINPYTEEQESMLCCWDGQRWFPAKPIKDVIFVSAEEIDSELTAWANNGAELFPLFQTPSAELEKLLQTKLRADPLYITYKQVNRQYIVAETFSEPMTFELAIDTELGNGPLVEHLVGGPALQFFGLGPITFVGSGPIQWVTGTTNELAIYGFQTSAYGRMFGMTAKTSCPDCRVLSLSALYVPQYSEYA